jgi:cation diffusion facilitator CzcD-associated flavoprotein CzcO
MNAGSAMTKGTKPYDVDVAIFGSGFGGLCMGIKLKEAGIDNFVILEKDEMYAGVSTITLVPPAMFQVTCIRFRSPKMPSGRANFHHNKNSGPIHNKW